MGYDIHVCVCVCACALVGLRGIPVAVAVSDGSLAMLAKQAGIVVIGRRQSFLVMMLWSSALGIGVGWNLACGFVLCKRALGSRMTGLEGEEGVMTQELETV